MHRLGSAKNRARVRIQKFDHIAWLPASAQLSLLARQIEQHPSVKGVTGATHPLDRCSAGYTCCFNGCSPHLAAFAVTFLPFSATNFPTFHFCANFLSTFYTFLVEFLCDIDAFPSQSTLIEHLGSLWSSFRRHLCNFSAKFSNVFNSNFLNFGSFGMTCPVARLSVTKTGRA